MTVVRFAWDSDNPSTLHTFSECAEPVALLVSFYYLKSFERSRERIKVRDWVMDSGAFSAHNSGAVIDLDEYIETCQRLLATDDLLTEVFSLDVIGDHKASLRNCEKMWKAGVPAIPTFHVGSPEDALIEMAKTYPKIALGGAVGYGGKEKWAEQCFARVYPKRIHGLGWGGRRGILALPWHSVDASNWRTQPGAFGLWKLYGRMSVRNGNVDLRSQVDWFQSLEREAKRKWAREMQRLEEL